MPSLLVLLACAPGDPVSVDSVVEQWWHLEDQFLNIYLEQDAGVNGGTLWYDYFGPAIPLEDNYYGGEWAQLDENRFRLEWEGAQYTLRAFPSLEHSGCYELKMSFVAEDLACPYDEATHGIGGES